MDFDDSDKEPPNWLAVFFDSLPEHTSFGFEQKGSPIVASVLCPVLIYGIFVAPVFALAVYVVGGLRGYSFVSGWMLSAFLAFGLHMTVSALYALFTMGEVLDRLRLRHKAWLQHQAEMAEQGRQGLVDAKRQAASKLLDELIAEGENRRLAPMRAAQARAQRLATLELALEEAFNRYRYAHDVTGTADMNALRQGFIRELQAKPLFSADDMMLLVGSAKLTVKGLLPKLTS